MMFFVTLLVYALQESSKNPQTEPHAVVERLNFLSLNFAFTKFHAAPRLIN